MNTDISQQEEQRYASLQLSALDFAREGNSEELEKMIDFGMSVELSTLKGDSLLMLSSYNNNYETSKMLINKGAILDKLNNRGQTPLEGVCFKGDLSIVELLVQNGAKEYTKAITYAAIFGHEKIVKYLKSKNKYTKQKTIMGINPEFIAFVVNKIKSLFKNKNI